MRIGVKPKMSSGWLVPGISTGGLANIAGSSKVYSTGFGVGTIREGSLTFASSSQTQNQIAGGSRDDRDKALTQNYSCASIVIWVVVCAWTALLLACWHSGLVTSKAISHGIEQVEYFASSKAQHLLRRGGVPKFATAEVGGNSVVPSGQIQTALPGDGYNSSIKKNTNIIIDGGSSSSSSSSSSSENKVKRTYDSPLIHPIHHSKPPPPPLYLPTLSSSSSSSSIQTPQSKLASEAVSNDLSSPVLHVVFSTDCNAFQDWQTLVLFHSAIAVGQSGSITRICGGCPDDKKAQIKALYEKLYKDSKDSKQFRVHFTPDFSHDETTGKQYNFYNKPRGLQHWLDHGDHGLTNHDVIALIDPDMIFLRPLTTNIRGMPNNLWDKKHIRPDDLPQHVSEGLPVGQLYGLGAPWTNDNHKKFNRGKICGEGSACLLQNERYAAQHFSVGPPYIANRRDMVRISKSWNLFVPRVYNGGYPFLLAEMYAYSMAAAHESLPHLQMEHYMISNIDAYGEGWPLVDQLPDEDVCKDADENGHFLAKQPLPVLIHYCQSFKIHKYLFGKRRLPQEIFSCEHPLFIELPIGYGSFPESAGGQATSSKEDLKARKLYKRNAFMVCTIHRAINAALTHYKSAMCDGSTANLKKEYYMEGL